MIELGNIKIFTDKEVANHLGVSVRRIRSFIKKGQLAARRVGTVYHITEKKLEEFLECDSEAAAPSSVSPKEFVNNLTDDMPSDMADDISRLDAILGTNEKSQDPSS